MKPAILIAVLTVSAAAALQAPAAPEAPAPNGRIAYTYWHKAVPALHVIGADGKGDRPLFRLSGKLDHAQWSPDGRRIAFSRTLESDQGIWVAQADGRRARRLTTANLGADAPFMHAKPAWSPDGRRILFTRLSLLDNRPDLYVINADGSRKRKLVANAAGGTWSPDGRSLAFTLGEAGVSSVLYLARADGRARRQVSRGFANVWGPSWSPDGRRLAFAGVRQKGAQSDIYTMNLDGSGVEQLTSERAVNFRPTWSPDGRWILFSAVRNRNQDLYVMRADGSEERRLTTNPEQDDHPSWQRLPRRRG